ncbi:MAG TPA: nucleoside recognition domain-containing protein [Bacteroidales bacterium]|nr:nucleoside recognition domain-containing protein [Bacteroidales bacterium]
MKTANTTNTFSSSTLYRLKKCFLDAWPKALATSIWLLKIMLPVTFGVLILNYTGLLEIMASWFAPLLVRIGLPGESALVLITSVFTNIYSAIAVITTLGFEMRAAIIIAVMCLVAHGFILESAVVKKTGSNIFLMLAVRIVGSIIAGIMLNAILPDFTGRVGMAAQTQDVPFLMALKEWFINSLFLVGKIIVLIMLLMFLQKVLEEFGIIRLLSRLLKPFMKVMGLPENTTFSWIVANTLGLAYGSAIIIDQKSEGVMSKEEADLLNYHIVLSHSQLEDPLLFVAIGLPFWWLVWPRVLLAIVAVWLRRLVGVATARQAKRAFKTAKA